MGEETEQILQQIIDEQIELVGEEQARAQAEAAGIKLDEDGDIAGYEEDSDESLKQLRYEITGNEWEEEPEDEQKDEDEDEERQEYYLETIRDIVDEQKEYLGEETALKVAHQAPLNINAKGEVVDFYGRGEDAVAILRSFTEHQEFYLKTIRNIVDAIADFFGDQIALGYARSAPLEVNAEGEIEAYYGKGRQALEILVEQFENDIGREAADEQLRAALQDLSETKHQLLPERIRPREQGASRSLVDAVRSLFGMTEESSEHE
ncbi:MAG: hypothetical protein SVU32_04990 [Candidatus Nanohaloarchaea archaeon]|nr:hypothetical protein [Candidatus Nanohaloarchaea archaeon]